jgi:hypothetical protein
MKTLFSLMFLVFTMNITYCQTSEKITARFYNIPEQLKIPEGMAPLRVTWNSTGMDPFGNMYVVYCDEKGSVVKDKNTTGNDYSDCAFIKFDTKTEKFEIIASLVDVLKAENNWKDNEFVEKGHTPLPYLNGKIYMGTMEFHSIEGKREDVLKKLKQYRGSHLLSYDVKTGEIKDVTKNMPGGILFPQQGMIACDALPEYNLIVCMSTPKGDIALYNTITEKVDTIIPGPDSELGNVIYRKIVTTPNGKAYFGFRGFKNGEGHLYVLDINTNKVSRLHDLPRIGFRGYVNTSDRKHFYAISEFGEIISIDPFNDDVKVIGNILPEAEYAKYAKDDNLATLTGMVLSPDDKKLFAIPTIKQEVSLENSKGKVKKNGKKYLGLKALGVYEFDIETKTSQKVYDFSENSSTETEKAGLEIGRISGSGLMDSKGRIYFARNGKPGFTRIDLSSRIDSIYLEK